MKSLRLTNKHEALLLISVSVAGLLLFLLGLSLASDKFATWAGEALQGVR